MTDLSRLRVSLTKHNAHKIAGLLKRYGARQILARLSEVHAEETQARKNLSILAGDRVPAVWDKAKKLGDNAIDALVFVGIVFSHHKLIEAMTNASARGRFFGRIERGIQLDDKTYTNFARVIDQLGFSTTLDYSGVSFNLRAIFELPGLGPLVSELLGHKLDAAGWDRLGSVSDEAISQGFHRAFGVEKNDFVKWLNTGAQPVGAGTSLLPKDEDFFQTEGEGRGPSSFVFRPGHTHRAVEPVPKSASPRTKANQLHNDIQNRLYSYLCEKLGAPNVGTELETGEGTTIDVATKQNGKVTFYEIKTATSVRASIRQAIPQLLEYAYWPSDHRADELVIVSQLPITKIGRRYLSHLQTLFGLPLSYSQFNLRTGTLV